MGRLVSEELADETMPERGRCACKAAGGSPETPGLKCIHADAENGVCKLESGEHEPAWWLHEMSGSKWPGPDGSRPADTDQDPPGQVHIAGPDLQVSGVVRQRCAWCGALILEHDLANMASPIECVDCEDQGGEDGQPCPTCKRTEPMRPAVWTPGALVLVQGTWPRMTTTIEPVVQPDGTPEGAFAIPPNSCMSIEPDVTR